MLQKHWLLERPVQQRQVRLTSKWSATRRKLFSIHPVPIGLLWIKSVSRACPTRRLLLQGRWMRVKKVRQDQE